MSPIVARDGMERDTCFHYFDPEESLICSSDHEKPSDDLASCVVASFRGQRRHRLCRIDENWPLGPPRTAQRFADLTRQELTRNRLLQEGVTPLEIFFLPDALACVARHKKDFHVGALL